MPVFFSVSLLPSLDFTREELRLRTTTSPPQDLWEEMLPLTLADASESSVSPVAQIKYSTVQQTVIVLFLLGSERRVSMHP